MERALINHIYRVCGTHFNPLFLVDDEQQFMQVRLDLTEE